MFHNVSLGPLKNTNGIVSMVTILYPDKVIAKKRLKCKNNLLDHPKVTRSLGSASLAQMPSVVLLLKKNFGFIIKFLFLRLPKIITDLSSYNFILILALLFIWVMKSLYFSSTFFFNNSFFKKALISLYVFAPFSILSSTFIIL